MSKKAKKRKTEKINFTFPVAIEWIIEEKEVPFNYEDQNIFTKIYDVPGFPWFSYFISFITKLQPKKFIIEFCRKPSFAVMCELESSLCLTINNGEPKKISQKFKGEDDLLLCEGLIEELNKSKKCLSDPVTLRLNGSITVHAISRKEEHYDFITPCLKYGELDEPKDFIIEVEKQEIQVHKTVLQKYSPVFSAMFENGWKEASEGRVVIPEFPFKIVNKAVELCYDRFVNIRFENPELILLYRFADKYDMDEITDILKESILLTPNNICEYANLFHSENCPIFVNHCIDRLIVYFQFSYPVKDLETLNNDIKLQFFTQASISQAMKKEFNPDYHRNLNDEDEEEDLPLL